MARPQKQGLDYFPLDVDLDQDDKLGMIIGEFDSKGEYAYTKLLCWIYKNEGYFTEWNEEVQLKFMRRYKYCGFSLNFIVKELVPRCLKWELFDQAVFETFQVLTSSRIQETWLEVSRKRTGRTFVPNYWLIGVNDAVKPEEILLIPEVIDKQNQSKTNQTKGNEGGQSPNFFYIETSGSGKKNIGLIPPSLQEAKDFFLKVIGNLKKPANWPPEKCDNEARKFHDYYTANGWVQGSEKKPIVDWEAAARGWINKEREGTFAQSGFGPKQHMLSSNVKPALSKEQSEINFLYGLYRKDWRKVTIKSIYPSYYDKISRAGLIAFSQEKESEIKNEAIEYLTQKNHIINDAELSKWMKMFGVLHFFKDLADRGHEIVFDL